MTDLTIERLASLAGESIFDRGQQYFRSGRVLSVTADNGSVRGRVKGSDQYPYRVEIDLRPQRLGARCTCPFNMGPWCKHAVAVAMSYCLDGSKKAAAQSRASGRPPRNGHSARSDGRAVSGAVDEPQTTDGTSPATVNGEV
ncbi:MAG: SWIM zinc finger family protein, partial [Blastocatellia bacterium]